jgi:AGCS family alanine or glycine:cation symporter
MALPNLIGVVFLSGTVFAITKNYLARRKGEKLRPMLSAYPEIQDEQERKLDDGD